MPEDPRELFAREYARLNRDVYGGRLPAFPGVRVTNAGKRLGSTHWRQETRADGRVTRTLLPFRISRYNTDADVLLDTIRHEIAHAAAALLDGERGHGPRWKRHAVLCGATPEACTAWDPATGKEPLVVVACASCGTRTPFYRATKVAADITRYACGKCRARTLTVEKNAAKTVKKPVAVVRCRGCTRETPYYRRGKVVQNPRAYRCRGCGGALEVRGA